MHAYVYIQIKFSCSATLNRKYVLVPLPMDHLEQNVTEHSGDFFR